MYALYSPGAVFCLSSALAVASASDGNPGFCATGMGVGFFAIRYPPILRCILPQEESVIIARDRIKKVYQPPDVPLTDSDIIAIRTERKNKMATLTDLAIRYQRSGETIRDIEKGRTYKNIPL